MGLSLILFVSATVEFRISSADDPLRDDIIFRHKRVQKLTLPSLKCDNLFITYCTCEKLKLYFQIISFISQ